MENRKYLLFSAHIKETYKNLTPTEKVLADYMLEHPGAIINTTARELAEKLNISTATVIRFCRSCGFSGLSDLKLSLQREHAAIDDRERKNEVVLEELKRSDSVTVIKQKVLGYHNAVINMMLSDWNEDAYSLAVDALLSAKRIVIIGEGGCLCTAICLFSLLTNMKLPAETYMDNVFEIAKLDSLQEGDAVIAVTYTGRTRNMVENAQLAKERGAVVIGLVGFLKSPIMEYVDIPLPTRNLKTDYYDSALSTRVSELAVVEILTTLLSVRLDRPIRESKAVNMRRIDGDFQQK